MQNVGIKLPNPAKGATARHRAWDILSESQRAATDKIVIEKRVRQDLLNRRPDRQDLRGRQAFPLLIATLLSFTLFGEVVTDARIGVDQEQEKSDISCGVARTAGTRRIGLPLI